MTQVRAPIVDKMERTLEECTEQQHQCSVHLSAVIIQAKQLSDFFKHTDTAISITADNDANRERSAKVTTAIKSAVACYKELYSKRVKAACQLSLHYFLRRTVNPLPLQDSRSSLSCCTLTSIL
jgi:hypothetical protein